MNINVLLVLCTFSPLTLLFNDLVIQPLPVSPFLPRFLHLDDVFKIVVFNTISCYLIHRVDIAAGVLNGREIHPSFLFLALTSCYFYGFAINTSHNALGNYLEKRSGIDEKLIHEEVSEGIFFYDEYMGHWIAAVSYSLLQFRWVVLELQKGSRKPVPSEKSVLPILLASTSGFITAFALLEAQAMFFFVYILLVMVLVPSFVKYPSTLVTYIQVQAAAQLGIGLYWRFFLHGSWVEPSELAKVHGMNVVQIMSLGSKSLGASEL